MRLIVMVLDPTQHKKLTQQAQLVVLVLQATQ
jgi:hypothetical protein